MTRRAEATTLWRWIVPLAVVLLAVLCVSCGDIFRPVANPIPGPPPDPRNYHFAIVINRNAPANPGTGMQIDVSGDTNVGVVNTATNPVHASLLPPNAGRVYVANGTGDSVSTFTPASTGGSIGAVTTISLPTGSNPVFVHSTESATMYVANAGAANVATIATASNAVTQFIPVGPNPSVLAETPDGQKLYSVNRGDGSVSSINTVNKSVNPPIVGFSTPVWAVAGLDSKHVFVLNQGNGSISVIDTFSDTVPAVTAATAGAGANFMFLDSHLNRLYVTNPGNNTVTIFDAAPTNTSVSPAVPPSLIRSVPMPAGASNPVMVTALADGTKAYVVSNQNNATCPTAGVNSPCLTAEVTTIRTSDNTVIGQPISLGAADLNAGDIDPGALAACSGAQFRTSIASSVDSTKVYAAVCDAGMISIIRTSDDTLVLPMHSPLSTYAACSVPPQAPPPQPCPAGPLPPPPPQNPVWVVAGR